MQRSGIILELNPPLAVVLTPDGQFCRIPSTPDMSVGVEVLWEVVPQKRRPGHRRTAIRRPWRNMGVASAAAVLAVAAGVWALVGRGPLIADAEPYGYVALDINPSVALVVDRHFHVLSATATDPDGDKLLLNLDLQGQPLPQAIRDVVDAAARQHMIASNDVIVVATAPAQTTTDAASVQREAAADVRAALQTNAQTRTLHPQVYSVGVSRTAWQYAHRANIPPTQLAEYLMAQKQGFDVSSGRLDPQSLRRALTSSVETTQSELENDTNTQVLQNAVATLQMANDQRGKGEGAGRTPMSSTDPAAGGEGDQGAGGRGTPGGGSLSAGAVIGAGVSHGDGSGGGSEDGGGDGQASGAVGRGQGSSLTLGNYFNAVGSPSGLNQTGRATDDGTKHSSGQTNHPSGDGGKPQRSHKDNHGGEGGQRGNGGAQGSHQGNGGQQGDGGTQSSHQGDGGQQGDGGTQSSHQGDGGQQGDGGGFTRTGSLNTTGNLTANVQGDSMGGSTVGTIGNLLGNVTGPTLDGQDGSNIAPPPNNATGDGGDGGGSGSGDN